MKTTEKHTFIWSDGKPENPAFLDSLPSVALAKWEYILAHKDEYLTDDKGKLRKSVSELLYVIWIYNDVYTRYNFHESAPTEKSLIKTIVKIITDIDILDSYLTAELLREIGDIEQAERVIAKLSNCGPMYVKLHHKILETKLHGDYRPFIR